MFGEARGPPFRLGAGAQLGPPATCPAQSFPAQAPSMAAAWSLLPLQGRVALLRAGPPSNAGSRGG
eukprot:13337272-Alexandrium_andersonii.AAC.1